MKNIQEVALRIHTEIMHQKGINQESTVDMEIRPKNGITSETIVFFILELEEELGIQLDNYLPQIRKAKTIQELINIVSKACEDSNNV